MQEIRCEGNKLHAVVVDDHTLEFACDSRFCGARKGVVVRHRFNLQTGQLSTKLYRARPMPAQKEGVSDSTRRPSSIRTA